MMSRGDDGDPGDGYSGKRIIACRHHARDIDGREASLP